MASENGAMVPRVEQAGGELVLPPDAVTFQGIARCMDDDKLGFLDKCVLARERTKALVAQRKQQFAAALKAQEMKIHAEVNMAARAVALYRDNFEFEVSGAYVKMLEVLGERVETSKLEFLRQYAKKLTAFEEQLAVDDIKPSFKEKILDTVEKAFNNLYDKLGKLTEEVIMEAQQKKRS